MSPVSFLYFVSLTWIASISGQLFMSRESLAIARLLGNPWRHVAEFQGSVPGECVDSAAAGGKRFRGLLVGKYAAGKWTGAEIAELAHWHTISGGCGAEDLGVKPGMEQHANEHIKLVLGRDFVQPELAYFKCPLIEKGTNRKEMVSIPVRLVHETLADEHRDDETPLGDDPLQTLPLYGGNLSCRGGDRPCSGAG
jgi:hypothetical protein